jgi:hypothetical protein
MPSQPTIRDLQTTVESNAALQEALRADPGAGLKQAAEEAAQRYAKESDPVIYRTVVYVLSAVVILTALALALTLFMKTVTSAPTELVALGSTALGALAGLLAPSPVRPEG